MKYKAFLLLLILCIPVSLAFGSARIRDRMPSSNGRFGPAAEDNWVGGTGNWSDGKYWSLGRAPESGDDVVIYSGVADYVTLGAGTVTVKSLTLGGVSNGFTSQLVDGDTQTVTITDYLTVGSSGLLSFYGNGSTIDLSGVTTNRGRIEVAMNSALNNSGNFTNFGQITSTGHFWNFATLHNFGTVRNAAVFNNSGNVINEAGVVFNNNGGNFGNSASGAVDNFGTLNNQGGTFINAGSFVNESSGSFANYLGGMLDNSGTFTNFGSFNKGFVTNTGTINNYGTFDGGNVENRGDFYNRATLKNITSAWTNYGYVENTQQFANAVQFMNFGTLNNLGLLSVSGGNALLENHGVITNSGRIDNSASLVNFHGTITTSGTLVNSASFTNAGTLTNTGSMTNSGDMQTNSPGSFENRGSFYNSGTLSNGGGVITNRGSFENAGDVTNYGSFENAGTLNNHGHLANNGSLTNSGTLTNAGSISNYGTLTNSRDLTNDGGLVATFDGAVFNNSGKYAQLAGVTTVNGLFSSASTVEVDGGILGGTGTLQGNVLMNATMAPGDYLGAFHIQGNYTQTKGSIFDVQLAGLQPGVEYDQLLISGLALINGGTLRVALADGFTVQAGESFVLMTFAPNMLLRPEPYPGYFDVLDLPLLPDGETWQVLYDQTDITLAVVSSNFVGTPEPSTLIMLGLGLAGISTALHRRGKAADR